MTKLRCDVWRLSFRRFHLSFMRGIEVVFLTLDMYAITNYLKYYKQFYFLRHTEISWTCLFDMRSNMINCFCKPTYSSDDTKWSNLTLFIYIKSIGFGHFYVIADLKKICMLNVKTSGRLETNKLIIFCLFKIRGFICGKQYSGW